VAKIRVTVNGHERYAQLARDLRELKDKELTKAMYRGLYEASFPIQRAAIEGTVRLPKTGGRDAVKYRLKKTGTKTIYGKEYVTRTKVRAKGTKPAESLAARVAQARFSVRGSGSRTPRIKLLARAKSGHAIDLRRLDAGFVRHPVFAHGPRGLWHWIPKGKDQPVPSGWFSEPVQQHSEEVRKALLVAVDKVTEQLRAKG
jgi:hypothetical protein